MVLMAYVFKNGSHVFRNGSYLLCSISCVMCENKNAKHHRIRGWHIGLWQRKLVGVPSWLGSSHLIRPGRAIRRQMLTASSVISTPAQNKQKYRQKCKYPNIHLQIHVHTQIPSGRSRDSYLFRQMTQLATTTNVSAMTSQTELRQKCHLQSRSKTFAC